MNMENDRRVVVLVVSSIDKNVELFRVHIHEQSIRFDTRFTQGIEKNPELLQDVNQLNELWKSNKIQTDHIFPIVLHIMDKYGEYLRDYYFKDYELDKEGHYIESLNEEKTELQYQHLKKSKQLKRISKKEFEKNISSKEMADSYVENYVKKGARFYKNDIIHPNGAKVIWFFMVVDDKLKMSFSVNTN